MVLGIYTRTSIPEILIDGGWLSHLVSGCLAKGKAHLNQMDRRKAVPGTEYAG